MPEYLRFMTYHLPILDQTREKCDELYQLPYVENVMYYAEGYSVSLGAHETFPREDIPCVGVRVNVARMTPNTPSRVQEIMLEILESDDAEKAEGDPPGTVS